MKFVFFGSPEFAAIVLEKLLEAGYTPLAVVTNPDRPVGRKQIETPPAVKALLQARGLESQVRIFQPKKPVEILEDLRALEADFFVVASYAKIIPQSVLDLPRLGTIGVHPSLLPLYRGASPIQSVLLDGGTRTGVALYLLGAGVDDGPVFIEEDLDILPDEGFESLLPRLAELGGKMLAALIPEFVEGKATPRPQDGSAATLTRKFKTEDGFVPEEDLLAAMSGDAAKASDIHNRIRALTPEPGVWTLKNGKRIKLLQAEVKEGRLALFTIHREGKTPEPYRQGVL